MARKPKNAAMPTRRLNEMIDSMKPLEVNFEWTNEEWALAHLTMVRLAVAVCRKTPEELREAIRGLIQEGIAEEKLEDMAITKKHLQALVKLTNCALSRQFIMLESMGFSPDNPRSGTPKPQFAH